MAPKLCLRLHANLIEMITMNNKRLFVLTEFDYKHIDERGLPVKRSISGMHNRSKIMGGLNIASQN